MIDPTLSFPTARHDRVRLLARLARVVPEPEIAISLPLLDAIGELKAARDAVIVAHNYQVPLISAGVADFVGDSLAMARFAAESAASVICVCGVYFMAETVKLLCPDKRVLLPNLLAGCSLAESITAEDVAALRRCHPHFPVVAYVNTSAAVKAEADICCTSANAVAVARGLAADRLILIPDRYLARYVAAQTGLTVVGWEGQCDVHARYSGMDIDAYRVDEGAAILAHPECPTDVQSRADFVGSTSAMVRYLAEQRPRRVLLLTECSMADNLSMAHPEIEFLKPCNLCTSMKSITLGGVLGVLEGMGNEIFVDEAVAVRARRSVQRMLAF